MNPFQVDGEYKLITVFSDMQTGKRGQALLLNFKGDTNAIQMLNLDIALALHDNIRFRKSLGNSIFIVAKYFVI